MQSLSMDSPWIWFEVEPNHTISPSPTVSFRVPGRHLVYNLYSVIYLGENHFTARMQDSPGKWWNCDGMWKSGTARRNHIQIAKISSSMGPTMLLSLFTAAATADICNLPFFFARGSPVVPLFHRFLIIVTKRCACNPSINRLFISPPHRPPSPPSAHLGRSSKPTRILVLLPEVVRPDPLLDLHSRLVPVNIHPDVRDTFMIASGPGVRSRILVRVLMSPQAPCGVGLSPVVTLDYVA